MKFDVYVGEVGNEYGIMSVLPTRLHSHGARLLTLCGSTAAMVGR